MSAVARPVCELEPGDRFSPRITWKPSGEVHRTGSRAATHLRQRAAVQQVIRAVNVWLYSKEEVGR